MTRWSLGDDRQDGSGGFVFIDPKLLRAGRVGDRLCYHVALGHMNTQSSQRNYLIYALLAAATIAVYWQVHSFGFVGVDDFIYASENRHVLGGISGDSVRWAFTTSFGANWHPLTWISLMLDAQIAGRFHPGFARSPSAGVFHVTNAALHVLSTLILFAALRLMTGERWKSAFVAALFGLHPLHVESVAWVSERKDVLSGAFWMLTMLAYARYVRKPTALGYGAALVLFALGLMSKPMLVSLPVVMLMLDYWPLGRIADCRLQIADCRTRSDPSLNAQPSTLNPGCPDPRPWASLVLEKAPFVALSAAACAVTLWAQSSGGAVVESDLVPVGQRLANAAVSAVAYIVKAACPLNLAAFYPHPEDSLPLWQVVGSALVLAGACAAAVMCVKGRKYVTVGWSWYLVTLVPVIGLVQVGEQGMADRYTYLPLVGLFIAAAWGVPDALSLVERRAGKELLSPALRKAVLIALLVGLAAASWFQVGYWKDTITLYGHAVEVAKDNWQAHTVLAAALHGAHRDDEALEHALKAVNLKPGYSEAHYRLGVILAAKGALREAVAHYQTALSTDPLNAEIHNDLGCALGRLGDLDGAAKEFEKALRLNPNHKSARKNLNAIRSRAEVGSRRSEVGRGDVAGTLPAMLRGRFLTRSITLSASLLRHKKRARSIVVRAELDSILGDQSSPVGNGDVLSLVVYGRGKGS